MYYKFVTNISFIIEVINYKLIKIRRKIFFSPISTVSLLQILLMNISSLSYFIIILDSLLNQNLHFKLFKIIFIEERITNSYLFTNSENSR